MSEALKDAWGGSSARGITREKSGIRYSSADSEYRADPSDVVSRFTSVDAREDDLLGTELPELDLPGFGEEYEDCGEDIPRFCADCGSTHVVGRTCYRSVCPRCGASWTRRQGTAVAAKLEATRRYLESSRAGWDGYKFHHLAVSPPDGYETFTNEALDRTFEVLKEVLGELGVDTGVIFYHPYRGEDGDDRGAWKGRLFEGIPWEDVREDLEHSPHFHVVAIAKHVDGGYVTKAIEEQTGWLVERITKGEDSNVSIYDKYDLCRVVSYCLSHTGLRETESGRTRAAYRYFGRVANLPAEDHIEREMDAAMRSIAPRTLGLSWSDVACAEDREGREPQGWLVGDTSAAYRSGVSFEDDDDLDEDVDPPDGKCGGRLLFLGRAPEFLDDDEWRAAAPHADELAETWEEWEGDLEDWPPPD